MAPTPQDHESSWNEKRNLSPGERIVISGISGLYPQSENVKEFADILYSKSNPVKLQTERWNYEHPEVVHYVGTVPGLAEFDAQFFKVHYGQALVMDPMSRKLLEQTYQAIYDAGLNPEEISGKKIGVYVGVCLSETEKACFYSINIQTGLGIAGCCKAMFANRISYWLNAKGPSIAVDEGCTSSARALELAHQAIRRGECDMAVVGGSSLCLHPQSLVHHARIIHSCPDGKTKSFDENADGCARSEALNVIFLQKAKDALRIYAEVVHVKCEYTDIHTEETGPKYGFYRDSDNIRTFIKNFYDEVNILPKSIEYVEALGSAVPESDKAELEAISSVFCKDRNDALLVGSVMSNVGYTEAASALVAVTKVLMAYKTGKIPSNLHCESPRKDINALREGKIKIVTDHMEFGRSYVAINGRSITGTSTHALLRGHYMPKDLSRYKSNIPHLVAVSGRQETAVERIIKDLVTRPVDPEELALLRNIHKIKISGHLGRGFAILDTNELNETVSLCEKINYYDDTVPPLWFVYSGMGSQWVGMGKQLLNIPIFAVAIEKCDRVLKPLGLDIYHIITSDDKTTFDNIQNSFVGIAAIQIGLTDILTALGIIPDNIIGHSVGELGCAYADGCFTAEEMILAACKRGQVSIETEFIHGAMAAVGLGYRQVIKICPAEIEVACHNSSESCTISGPTEAIKAFVKVLVAKGIFAREVPCSNIAYHSRYIAHAGPGLLKYLKPIIKSPKLRSKRWVSTSVPMNRWDEPIAQYSSAEYHTNNLLNPVLFEEVLQLIPSNAVCIEIAPHGLLQAILKRAFPSCRNVPLTRRGHPNNVQLLLQAIGELYIVGYNPNIQALYPKVEFPVSTGTPPLSHLVVWAHEEKWRMRYYWSAQKKHAPACNFFILKLDDEYSYLSGHIIRGKNQLPFAAALLLVWDTFAMALEQEKRKMSVQFRDVHFHLQPLLEDKWQLHLRVTIQRGNGRFEVLNENIKVVTGFISAELINTRTLQLNSKTDHSIQLSSKDIYQLFHTKNFYYSGEFRSLKSANLSLDEAKVSWNNNWVILIDAMLQLNTLRQNHKIVSIPDALSKITIDVKEHEKIIQNKKDPNILTINIFETQDCTRCGGVVIEKIIYQNLSPLIEEAVTLKALKFVPHFPNSNSDVSIFVLKEEIQNMISTNIIAEATASYVYLQIAADNLNKQALNIVEIVNDKACVSNYETIKNIGDNIPGIKTIHSCILRENILEKSDKLKSADLVLITNLSDDKNMFQTLHRLLKQDILLVNKELYLAEITNKSPSMLYRIVNVHIVNDTRIELAIWRPSNENGSSVYTVRSSSDLAYISSLLPKISLNHKIFLQATYPLVKGLKALVKQWRKDRRVYLTMINHDGSDYKFLDEILYKDLLTNIYENGVWGGEYILPLEEKLVIPSNMMLKCSHPGDFDSLNWVEAPELDDNGIHVDVHYAGLNLLYVKEETGVIDTCNAEKRAVKVDFSGTTKTGNRVMGLTPNEVISTRINAQPELLWPVPSHWSLEDAATVPLAYCLAFYCLIFKTQPFLKNHVLVHGGAGALGQAFISIVLALGYEIFVTVGDIQKKRFLRKLFPQLKDDHIGHSRDPSFGDMILNTTKGKGCEVIVNCLQGELKNITLRCCASNGVTIDVSQLPNREDFNFGMHNLYKSQSYVTVDLSSIFEKKNMDQLLMLQGLVSEGIARGFVKPLSRVTYSQQDAPRAFRLLTASRHCGRVLLDLRKCTMDVLPRLKFASDLKQIIVSNDQGLVMQLTEKLITRGAKNINIFSKNIYNSLVFKQSSWKAEGVKVKLAQENIDVRSFVDLIKNNKKGSEEGIYYSLSPNEEVDDVEELISNITTLLPALKYFAIIKTGFSGKQEININNSRIPLGVRILMPDLYKAEESDNISSNNFSLINAADAIEKALCSKQPLVIASRTEPRRVPLMQNIAKIADIEIKQGSRFTLKDLGINLPKLEVVRAYLWNEYSISLPSHDISLLTIKALQGLEQKFSKGQEYNKKDGLKSFFSYVDPDELLGSCEVVVLPTLSETSVTDEDFDKNIRYMCIIPGVEGHYKRFRVMCESLKMAALVVQPSLKDWRGESIDDIAKTCSEIVITKTGISDRFVLLGYESGVFVALKMAEILEAKGLSGVVFCIGGSPDEIKDQFQDKLSSYKSEDALQTAIVKHMTNLILENSEEQLNNNLQNAHTWDEKVLACIRTLKGKVPQTNQYIKELIESAYTKVSQVLEYQLTLKKLRSKIVFIRPNESNKLENLQKYSHEPIIEYTLNTSFSNMTQDPRCTVLVNRHIGDDILKAFNKKNLCEIYYASGI